MLGEITCRCGDVAVWQRAAPCTHSFALADNEYLCDSCWCDLALTMPQFTQNYARLALPSAGALQMGPAQYDAAGAAVWGY